MAQKNKSPIAGLAPSHPGAILREIVLPSLGKKKGEIAQLLEVSRVTLDNILTEKTSLTPKMALKIGKLCGNGAEFWMRLQLQYDLWKTAQEVDVSHIPTLKAVA